MKISLILPTIGRKKELIDFINSLDKSKNRLSVLDEIELIIIDQNPSSFGLFESIERFIDTMNIKYILSSKKGLSFNRNLGIKIADGDYLCFPDDDCAYYPDTLSTVFSLFNSNPDMDGLVGRIYDRKLKCNVIKSWPSKLKRVNKFNFYFLSSSITIFVKHRVLVSFDDNMGAGASFGSCEDPDFLFRILRKKGKLIYTPEIDVWHPIPDMSTISLEKVRGYSSGFGYFVRKDLFSVKLGLLIMLVSKKIFQIILMKKSFAEGYFKAYFLGLNDGILKRMVNNEGK